MSAQSATEPSAPPSRGARKVRIGFVIKDRMNKTVVVRVNRLVRHRVYKRVVKRSASFKVHDEENTAKVGDWVRIAETRPLSKDKRWRLVEILRRSSTAPPLPEVQSEQVSKSEAPAVAGERPEGQAEG